MIYIGNVLKERMKLLNITIKELADMTFLEISFLSEILNNVTSVDDIDLYDLTIISNALHCNPKYFLKEECRNQDLLLSSRRKLIDDEKSTAVKLSIQDYLNDYSFLTSI